ncbi:hypothetical protein BKA70DRAFT_1235441 [Coprinopsis sp. MPI-PUGE-AT-0042]|nr:hypothetical protein BKA70DRAFT_1235441 [Coprinopsis sp. MPI-PUGE-AT-0042]
MFIQLFAHLRASEISSTLFHETLKSVVPFSRFSFRLPPSPNPVAGQNDMNQSEATSSLSNPCVDLTYNPACHYTAESFASTKTATIACSQSSLDQKRKRRSIRKATEGPAPPKKRSKVRHAADCTPVSATPPLEEPNQKLYTTVTEAGASPASLGLLTDSPASDFSRGRCPASPPTLPPCIPRDLPGYSFEYRNARCTSRPPDFVARSDIRTLGLGVQYPSDFLVGPLTSKDSSSSRPLADSPTYFEASQPGIANRRGYSHTPSSKLERKESSLSPPVAPKRLQFSEEYWRYIWGILDLLEAGSANALLGCPPEIEEERNGFTIISGQVLDATAKVARHFGLGLKREAVRDGKCALSTRTFKALHFAMSLEQAATTTTQNIQGDDLPSLSFHV